VFSFKYETHLTNQQHMLTWFASCRLNKFELEVYNINMPKAEYDSLFHMVVRNSFSLKDHPTHFKSDFGILEFGNYFIQTTVVVSMISTLGYEVEQTYALPYANLFVQ